MSQTISKGRMLRVTVAIDGERLKQMRRAPELAAQAVQAGADYWHSGILPRHFRSGAAATYGYAKRSLTYLRDPRKAGKPPLIFSGSLRNDLSAGAAFKQTAGGSVALTMRARILNLAPAMAENNLDDYVKHKHGRGYPNLKKEVKAITDDEREQVAVVVTRDLERSLDPAQTKMETIV